MGVFVGVSTPDYADLGKAHSAIAVYTATGSAVSVAAGRLSYFFGWSGPSVSGGLLHISLLCSGRLTCQQAAKIDNRHVA